MYWKRSTQKRLTRGGTNDNSYDHKFDNRVVEEEEKTIKRKELSKFLSYK